MINNFLLDRHNSLITIYVFVVNRISTNFNVFVKIIENNTTFSMQELHLFLFSLTIFTSLAVSIHSSASLSANFSLQLQFLESKYCPTSHDLSHLHSQLLGFQIYLLSHTPLSINSLHWHQHLSSIQRCFLSSFNKPKHFIILYYPFHRILMNA